MVDRPPVNSGLFPIYSMKMNFIDVFPVDSFYSHGADWPVSNLAQAAGIAALEDAENFISCGNFPGLDDSYYRIAISKKEHNARLLTTIAELTKPRIKPEYLSLAKLRGFQ